MHWRDQYLTGVRIDRSIVSTSSGSDLVNPLPGQTNYAAANAGVAAMTIVNALECPRSRPDQTDDRHGARPRSLSGAVSQRVWPSVAASSRKVMSWFHMRTWSRDVGVGIRWLAPIINM